MRNIYDEIEPKSKKKMKLIIFETQPNPKLFGSNLETRKRPRLLLIKILRPRPVLFPLCSSESRPGLHTKYQKTITYDNKSEIFSSCNTER